jgi:hypothetical protein
MHDKDNTNLNIKDILMQHNVDSLMIPESSDPPLDNSSEDLSSFDDSNVSIDTSHSRENCSSNFVRK